MLVMGAIPTLAGACLSGAIFAFAEMTFSPRFYDYIASFAPKGKAGMYMGLAFVPVRDRRVDRRPGVGLPDREVPPEGGRARPASRSGRSTPASALVCALAMVVYGVATARNSEDGRSQPRSRADHDRDLIR